MKHLIFLFVLIFGHFSAQKLTFISAKTKNPVSNLTVFSNSGKLVAISDNSGSVEKNLLKTSDADFTLVLNNKQIGTMHASDISGEIFPVEDEVVKIDQVVIKGKNVAKYIAVTGNFSSYVTSNNFLHGFSDGIATYYFNNKNKKLEGMKILQYRFYAMKGKVDENEKQVAEMDSRSFVEMPNFKDLKNLDDYKNSTRYKYTENISGESTFVNVNRSIFSKKPFKLFGYEFFDFQDSNNFIFITDLGRNLRGLTKYEHQIKMKLKHKSEPNFTQIVNYSTFYPLEVAFTDEVYSKKDKLDYRKSSYKNKFWQSPDFPNMEPIFDKFFKKELIEAPNNP